jgi:hypothetical protein
MLAKIVLFFSPDRVTDSWCHIYSSIRLHCIFWKFILIQEMQQLYGGLLPSHLMPRSYRASGLVVLWGLGSCERTKSGLICWFHLILRRAWYCDRVVRDWPTYFTRLLCFRPLPKLVSWILSYFFFVGLGLELRASQSKDSTECLSSTSSPFFSGCFGDGESHKLFA